MRLDPARSIIERLGGEALVREITGAGETAPYRWQHEKAKGGTGGLIPQRHIPALLTYARENGKAVTAEDFLPREPVGVSPAPAETEAA